MEISYLAALLIGLFGGVHCVGMCGGIVGALGFGLPEATRGRPSRFIPYLLAYNGGRLLSYTLAGALVGGVGLIAANLLTLHRTQLVLQLIAGLFMVALGFYLAGWWHGLLKLERTGGRLWRHIEPYGRRLMPVRRPGQAFILGMLWGWLPCGLVYTTLIWAVSSGGPVQGGLLMLSFGVGTLPNLLAMGLVAARLARIFRLPWVRRAAGVLVIAFGVVLLFRAYSGF